MTKITRRSMLAGAPCTLLAAKKRLRLIHTKGEKVAAYWGEQPLLEYRYDRALPKSYVHPLYLPNAAAVCVDGPADHIHLRGLMVAWSEVNGFDFWGEVNPAPHGQIVHQEFERLSEKDPLEIVATQHWIAEGKVLLFERRTLRVSAPLPEGIWLEWTTEFEPRQESVILGAGKHVYNGLGLRFLQGMTGGRVLNANGTATIQKANGEPATWCAYYAPLENGASAGVAILDHPGNPRHPTPFFVMNTKYGYLSAAPTFSKEPFPLKRGDRLRFHWGVLSFLGEPQAAALDRLHRDFSRRSQTQANADNFVRRIEGE